MRLVRMAIAFLAAGAHLAQAAEVAKSFRAPTQAASLDQKTIHGIYSDGDFDNVVLLIDAFTRAHPTYSKDDSIFIAKHLAVIYTANPATRERGKGHMFRLLELLPSAKIVDMFVSDEIDRIFERVREEYAVHERNQGRAKPSEMRSNQYAMDKMTVDPGLARGDRGKPGSNKALYWTLGGVAMAAAVGGTAYFLIASQAKPAGKDTVYEIH
jgi:hypothetical protein